MAVDSREVTQALAVAPLPCSQLARQLRRRKADVLERLRAEPALYERTGKGRGSRWRLKTAHSEQSTHELCRRADAALKLIEAGAMEPLDAIAAVVWPRHVALMSDIADAA